MIMKMMRQQLVDLVAMRLRSGEYEEKGKKGGAVVFVCLGHLCTLHTEIVYLDLKLDLGQRLELTERRRR